MPEVSMEVTGEGGSPDDLCRLALIAARETLKEFKPTDRSERARYYAVTITEIEKTLAYFCFWITNDEQN